MDAQARLRLFFLGGAGVFIALYLLVAVGCSGQPGASAPESKPSLALIPTKSPPLQVEREVFSELSKRYEETVDSKDNGWLILKPVLLKLESGVGLEGKDVLSLRLDKLEDRKFFDKSLLPLLRAGFSRPFFYAPHQLLQGKDPLIPYYRLLRGLCQLTVQRAQLAFEARDIGLALELVELPLRLAKATQSRPQTVSTALFSQSYAQTSLDTLDRWIKTDSLSVADLKAIEDMLLANSPSYSHLKETVLVDFAMLENSLKDDGTREQILGLGLLSDQEKNGYLAQIEGLLELTQALLEPDNFKDEAFTKAVLSLSPELQGLILEYPGMLTSLKLGTVSFYASQLGFRMKRLQAGKPSRGLPPNELYQLALQDLFGKRSPDFKAIKAMLELKPGADKGLVFFEIAAKPGYFKLISPQSDPVFFGG